MRDTVIHKLNKLGQSVWLDNINRSMFTKGSLKTMIEQGLRGMTSNPTIFNKAISNSDDYDEQIEKLCREGKNTFQIYDELTIADIQSAADIFRPIYEETNQLDGYVSLEINPKLAYKAEETILEGERLYKRVNRPNLMLKVPSTNEGFRPVEELTALGINVNITLIFSEKQYIDTAQAYLRGIKRLLENGGNPRNVYSVASVFVSRVDSVVDKLLDEKISKDQLIKNKITSLRGKAAIANSKLIYKKFLEISSSEIFIELRKNGVNVQRVLWGSTGTKDPAYSDIKYVTELIGKNTVNTMPEATYKSFLDHGEAREALSADTRDSEKIIRELLVHGVNINNVCEKLLGDGVVAFENSFVSLLKSIERKSKK